MRRLVTAALAACMLTLGLGSLSRPSQPSAELQRRVIVVLKAPPLAGLRLADEPATTRRSRAATARTAIHRFQALEIAYLRATGIKISPTYSFTDVMNGFGAVVEAPQIAALTRAAGVSAVMPEHRYRPAYEPSAALTRATDAWQIMGGASRAGHGLFIADIDSGIDIKNPCFGDAGFTPPAYGRRSDTAQNAALTNNKVVVARAFGDVASRHYSAADVNGHGTFTASVEACDAETPTPIGERISGMAPGAYLMSYNVFPAGSRGPYDDAVIAALDAAVIDGADVVNISLGSPLGSADPSLDPEDLAVQRAVKSGLVVVAAAGNGGPTAQSIASPADSPSAIAVGSVSNSRALYSGLSIAGGPESLSMVPGKQGSRAWAGTVGPSRVVFVGLARRPHDDPRAPLADDFRGKRVRGAIAIAVRGGSSSADPLPSAIKVRNAARAGSRALVIIDDTQENALPALDQGSANLPVLTIGKRTGVILRTWIGSHPSAMVTLHSALRSYAQTSDVLSDFSGRGSGPGFSLKPDLVAPGENVYAATQRTWRTGDMYDPSGFTSQSGTSFASPQVAGAAALVIQQHPTWSPEAVAEALTETANADAVSAPGHPGAAGVTDVGAGLLDVAAAITTPAIAAPRTLVLGSVNSAYGTVSKQVSIRLSDGGAGAGEWRIAMRSLRPSPRIRFTFPSSVQTPLNGSTSVPFRFTVARYAADGDFDGYLLLTQNDHTLRVPYSLHVARISVRNGSLLLIDDTASRLAGAGGALHADPDISPYYERVLSTLGKRFTYWNVALHGMPTSSDMRRASAVILFTGRNLNGFSPANDDPDSVLPPLGPLEATQLRTYLASGGRALIAGKGVGLADPSWLAVVTGAKLVSQSVYDYSSTDPRHGGGVQPWVPSAVSPSFPGPFRGLSTVDLGQRGDGAHDNGGVYNLGVGYVGVGGLAAVNGVIGAGFRAFGRTALLAERASAALAITSSDEPRFGYRVHATGRSLLMTFGIEGVNDTAGHARRSQLMQRALRWLFDRPAVRVTTVSVPVNQPARLQAELHAPLGGSAVLWQWDIGGTVLKAGDGSTWFTFPHSGVYRVRVWAADALGHAAVSGWSRIRVS